jgi:hypothetical protein
VSDLDPRGLRAEPAAAYCGLTISKFEARVRIGDLPKPLPFGRPHVWDRHALDQALDRLSRLRSAPATTGGNVVNLEVPRAGQNALRHR